MTISEAQYRDILRRIMDLQIKVEDKAADFITEDHIEPILEVLEEVAKQNERAG